MRCVPLRPLVPACLVKIVQYSHRTPMHMHVRLLLVRLMPRFLLYAVPTDITAIYKVLCDPNGTASVWFECVTQ